MVELVTLVQTKTAKKNIPFGVAHTHIANIREYPPPPRAKNALQTMSHTAYASETDKVNLSLTFTQRLEYSVRDCNSRNAGAVRLEIVIISIKYLGFLCGALNQSSAGRVEFSGKLELIFLA